MKFTLPMCLTVSALLAVCTSVDASDPLLENDDEGWDWSPVIPVEEGLHDSNSSVSTGTDGLSEYARAWLSLNATASPPNLTNVSAWGLVFGKEDLAFFDRLNSLIDGFLNGGDAEASGGEEFALVSVVTLMPVRCSDVRRVVELFDAAMQRSNPDANVSSVPLRLGNVTCVSSMCPCAEPSRPALRALEMRSTSRVRALRFPPEGFPYVAIRA